MRKEDGFALRSTKEKGNTDRKSLIVIFAQRVKRRHLLVQASSTIEHHSARGAEKKCQTQITNKNRRVRP